MTTIAVEDDKILRSLQVLLDPAVDPARVDAFRDYLSFDEPDPDGWFDTVRGRSASIYPCSVVMVRDEAEMRAALRGASAVVTESLRIGAGDLAPGLKLVQKFGVDARNIDAAACEAAGVAVRTLRRRVNGAVAEHALLLMMAVGRKLVETHGALDFATLRSLGYAPKTFDGRHVAGANWARITGLKSLQGAALGILGFGETGREAAARAAAMGMDILYHQRSRAPEGVEAAFNARYVSFGELLGRADFVSVHLPLNDSTEGMIDSAAFSRMKPGAVLVNVSRARIVDRGALIAALDEGRLGGAGLDVHYEEPGAPDEPLKQYRNVVLSPHIAVGARQHNMADIAELAACLADGLDDGSHASDGRTRAG